MFCKVLYVSVPLVTATESNAYLFVIFNILYDDIMVLSIISWE